MIDDGDIHPLCKRIRIVRGETAIRDFARQTGVHFNTLNNYEAGRMPSIEFLYKVVEVTKCSRDWLFFGSEVEPTFTSFSHVARADLELLLEISDLAKDRRAGGSEQVSRDEHLEIVGAAFVSLKSCAMSLKAKLQHDVIVSFVEGIGKLADGRGSSQRSQ